MKTKKLIPIFLILLLFSLTVSAFDMPWLIRGKVTIHGRPYEFQEITIQHIREGKTLQVAKVQTYQDGTYQYDVTQFPNRIYDTEEICVVACYDSNQCRKCVHKDSSGGKWVEFDITDPNAKIIWMGAIILIGAIALLMKKVWFKGMCGIIRFWYGKDKKRANKIIKTLERKILSGQYK